MAIPRPATSAGVVVPVPPAAIGMVLAATAKLGELVGFVTVGTSHDGHDPLGAAKLDTTAGEVYPPF